MSYKTNDLRFAAGTIRQAVALDTNPVTHDWMERKSLREK